MARAFDVATSCRPMPRCSVCCPAARKRDQAAPAGAGGGGALIWRQISQLRLVLPTTPAWRPWRSGSSPAGSCRSWCSRTGRALRRLCCERARDRRLGHGLARGGAGRPARDHDLSGGPLDGMARPALDTGAACQSGQSDPGPTGRPELLQEDCRPDRIAAAATRLIGDEALRQDQQTALAEAVAHLRGGDERPPSQRAAARILELLADRRNGRRTA